MDDIKLSVIVPVYNVEKYVSRCICSILNQDYKNIELILVDDGSTDKSGVICDSYKDDSRVKVFHQTNRGVSSARNLGLVVAEGKYLLFFDADDWLADNALSILVCNCNDADLIMFGAYNYIELEDGSYKLTKRIDFGEKNVPFQPANKYKDIFDKSAVLWTKMIKRTVVSDLQFDENLRIGEDADFLCRVLNRVNSTYIIPKELYYYHYHRVDSATSSRIDNRSLECIEAAKRSYDMLKENGATSSGFNRINTVAIEVMSRIPLTSENIKNCNNYLRAVSGLLRYPSFKERLNFYFNRSFGIKTRFIYFCMQFEPLYMFCRLLKKKC